MGRAPQIALWLLNTHRFLLGGVKWNLVGGVVVFFSLLYGMPAPSAECQQLEAWPASIYGHLREGYLSGPCELMYQPILSKLANRPGKFNQISLFISFLNLAHSAFNNNLRALIVSFKFVDCLLEFHNTFTLGINLK